MTEAQVDTLVLGAGAVGSAAAYHLARRGAEVALIEQFALGHEQGSSHGPSRVIRYSYANKNYARLMGEAYQSWRELEVDAGESVYTRTGGISICRPHLDYAERVSKSLADMGVLHRRMSGHELRSIAPVFQVADDDDVVFEPEIGLLAADRIVRIQARLAARHGVERFRLVEHAPVVSLDLSGQRPVVLAASQRWVANRLILTAGAWAAKLMPHLARELAVTRQCVAYFQPEELAPYSIGRFPVFIQKLENGHEAFYGMPDYEATGVKVGVHHNDEAVDPETVDRRASETDLERIREHLRRLLPGLAHAPARAATICLYSVETNEDFIVGPLPGRPDVLVASACSGHGFKFSNLVGRVLADLALEGGTAIDTPGWRLPPLRGPEPGP